MPETPDPTTERGKIETLLAVSLTLIAGYVDAIGFLRLGGVYVANMSGNSIALGIHSVQQAWPHGLSRLLPIASYVVGLFCARTVVDLAGLAGLRRRAAPAFAVEIVFLLLFAWSPNTTSGILLGAIAMGIQAATISRFNGVSVYTAFVTGTLVKMAEHASQALLAAIRRDRPKRHKSLGEALWFFGIWLAYVGGAATGAIAFSSRGVQMVLWACAILAALAILDLVRPAQFDVSA